MKALKQTFTTARSAVSFLESIWKLASWRDRSTEEPASIVLRLDYPFEIPSIEQCTFRGIESIAAKFKSRELPEFREVLAGRFGASIERSASASFLFRAHDPKAKKRWAQFSLFVLGDELLIRYLPACGTKNVDTLRAEYERFLNAVGLKVTVNRTHGGVRFTSGDWTRIEIPQLDGVDLPNLVDCYVPDKDRRQWLDKVVDEWSSSGLELEDPEFDLSFDYTRATPESAARKVAADLNSAGLPIGSARIELYYTIDSALDLQGLVNLKKIDRDNSTIEVTVAECVLPSKLKGFITVTARKSDLLVELHAQEAPDEEAFVKEARQVLKAHFK